MKTSIAIRADILKTLMLEDRQEIRTIRITVYKLMGLFASTSFAITSFLLGHNYIHAKYLCSMTDIFIVILVWLFFVRQKFDLNFVRKCLVARQNLIMNLNDANTSIELNPFPDVKNTNSDVNDSDLWWIPCLLSITIAIKATLIVLFLN